MHSSENEAFLVTRVLAYALNYEDGLEFTQGLSAPDEPAIRLASPNGQVLQWIDIGNPTARRMHKASKIAKQVRIYTYKDPENLKREADGEEVHRAEAIEIFALESKFLENLAGTLLRDNSWVMIHNDGEIIVTIGEDTYMTQMSNHRLS